jgi:hypothetical protein
MPREIATPYDEPRKTALWKIVETTHRDYIVGYRCEKLKSS